MARLRVWLTAWPLLMLILTSCTWAQSFPLTDSAAVMDKLARPAGIILSGKVIRIEREASDSNNPASIRIALRVEQAVRGCYAGDTIEIAEWASLWTRGDRYRVGQSLFVFLYPCNEAGLTSPVGGDLGTFLLGPHGLLRLTPQQALLLFTHSRKQSEPARFQRPSFLLKNDLVRRIREAR